MRLIDADALLNKKFKYMVHGRDDLLITIKASDIDNAPTIDAVEVVRCKDCRHCDPESKHCDHPMGTTMPFSRRGDDFCSHGERKEATE